MRKCSQRLRYLKNGLEPMRTRPEWTNATRNFSAVRAELKTRDFEERPKTDSSASLLQFDCSFDG